MTLLSPPLEFTLSDSNTATSPPEHRGVARDRVRLMTAHRQSGVIEHRSFHDLPDLLDPGDVLVVNTSRTIPAALHALTSSGTELRVHLASPLADGLWSLEVRTPQRGGGTAPGPQLEPQTLILPGGALAHLLARSAGSPRLWIAALEEIPDLDRYLAVHGHPIRYLPGREWPLAEYQTVFAARPGAIAAPTAGLHVTEQLFLRNDIAIAFAEAPVVGHENIVATTRHRLCLV